MVRGVVLVALASSLLGATVMNAGAQTPLQFIERFMDDTANTLNNKLRVAPKPPLKQANVPLLSVPMPHLRPVTSTGAVPILGYQPEADTIIAVPTDEMPQPRLRPRILASAISILPTEQPPKSKATANAPPVKLVSLPPEPLPDLSKPPPAAQSTCGLAIASLGVMSTPLAEIKEGECGVTAPVAVASLDGGAVDFSGRAIVECNVAETLANWVRKEVEPAAKRSLGAELTGLRIADSYSCRNRDNLPDAQLSEHAHGNAIDISAFRIGARWIEVGSGWRGSGADHEFLAKVRTSACGPFMTVLGPGSDSYHAEHFHLDIIRRGKNGRNPYCH